MTTRVTINAHAGWDVKVTPLDDNDAPTAPPTIIPAHTEKDEYVWEGRKLLIEEVRKDRGPA